MNELKMIKCLLLALIVISSTMIIWTVSYISATDTIHIQSTISAFNG